MGILSDLLIGARVKEARINAGLKQSELAEKIGKKNRWMSEVERGNITLTYKDALLIAHYCNVPVEQFSVQEEDSGEEQT